MVSIIKKLMCFENTMLIQSSIIQKNSKALMSHVILQRHIKQNNFYEVKRVTIKQITQYLMSQNVKVTA